MAFSTAVNSQITDSVTQALANTAHNATAAQQW
jgi:hypothetical protein